LLADPSDAPSVDIAGAPRGKSDGWRPTKMARANRGFSQQKLNMALCLKTDCKVEDCGLRARTSAGKRTGAGVCQSQRTRAMLHCETRRDVAAFAIRGDVYELWLRGWERVATFGPGEGLERAILGSWQGRACSASLSRSDEYSRSCRLRRSARCRRTVRQWRCN
jgi:hypothetical protein